MMKKYRIIKFGFAKDIQDALKNEAKLEIVTVELAEDVLESEEKIIGFK